MTGSRHTLSPEKAALRGRLISPKASPSRGAGVPRSPSPVGPVHTWPPCTSTVGPHARLQDDTIGPAPLGLGRKLPRACPRAAPPPAAGTCCSGATVEGSRAGWSRTRAQCQGTRWAEAGRDRLVPPRRCWASSPAGRSRTGPPSCAWTRSAAGHSSWSSLLTPGGRRKPR